MNYDLCIVGAGMFGSAAARHASANPTLKVCLVGPSEPKNEELKDREIFSSHYDEGRITRVLDEDPACQILSKHSINRYKELEKLSGIQFYSPVGCMFMVKKDAPYLQKILQASCTKNVNNLDVSSKETFERRYPYLRLKNDENAILDDQGGGHISPRNMVEAQKKVAKLQGCDIYENVVSEVKILENGFYQIETEEHSVGDKQSSLILTAKRVLITTGSFVNTKTFSALRPLIVKKYKRTVTLVRISDTEANRLSPMPSVIYHGKHETPPQKEISAYILPPIKYPDGMYYLKIGYSGSDLEVEKLEEIKQWYLSEGEKELVDLGLNLLTDLLPGLEKEKVSSLTCVNCYTSTGLPYIDRITPTLAVAVAGNGKGAKFSDEVGRLAAKLCITGNWDSELPKSRFEASLL